MSTTSRTSSNQASPSPLPRHTNMLNPTEHWWAWRARELLRLPEFWTALVLAMALFSFYVHVVNLQVERGEGLRDAQRSQVQEPRERIHLQRTTTPSQAEPQ